MQIPKWLVVILTLAYNAAMGLVQFGLVPDGSTATKAVLYIAWLIGLALMLFGAPIVDGTKKGISGTGLLLLLAFPVVFTGCTKEAWRAVGADAAKCVGSQVPGAFDDLSKQTLDSLMDAPGATDWKTFSKVELLVRGLPAAICVVQAALRHLDLSGMVASTAQVQADSDRIARAHQRGEAWLADHGVKHQHFSIVVGADPAPGATP